MKIAVLGRRVSLGILLGIVFGVAWVGWRHRDDKLITGTLHQRQAAFLQAETRLGVEAATEAERKNPATGFRARLLLRMMPKPSLGASAGSRNIEDVKSRPVLKATISSLRLSDQWSIGSGEALTKLESMVKLETDTSATATLLVSSTDREEASNIADGLVSAFRTGLETAMSDQSSRIAKPVYDQIKSHTESVERARNQMLECMNARQIVDYDFLNKLNGKPGTIQPELDAALNPDIKLAWFSHQLDTLKSLSDDEAINCLAAAVLPFDHPVTAICQTWKALAPVAAGLPEGTGVSFTGQKEMTDAAVESCRVKLEEWLSRTEQSLPAEETRSSTGYVSDKARQDEYRRLKQRYETEVEMLKTLQEHAARLFGDEAPFYVPPVVVLKRSVERLRP